MSFRKTAAAAFVLAAQAIFATQAGAHPMGNFSISHYAGIQLKANAIELNYIIDMAEIPAFQEMQQSGMPADPADPKTKAWLATEATILARGLTLTLSGTRLALHPVSRQILFSPGAGDLPTMKVGFVYRSMPPATACAAKTCELEYSDANFAGRTGWKEIVFSSAQGITPDRSAKLSNYPTDLLNSPPQDLTAKIPFTLRAIPHTTTAPAPAPAPVQAVVAPESPLLKPNRQATPHNAFTELIAHKEISLGFALIAALIAAGLGALHALEPGHGKTIVAAYLVGSRGTARHALLLGLIVTVSHTAGVYLLGGVTLYAQQYIMPDRLYPYLSVISGILIAGMGIYIFLKRFLGEEFAHKHGVGGHNHGLPTATNEAPGKRRLLILGITGGMVPCPAALVVLLSAVALHRTGFGLYLIVAFSMGLAAVLIGMGLTAVYAGKLLSKVPIEGTLIRLWLPAASSAMITLLGVGIAVRGLMAAGIVT